MSPNTREPFDRGPQARVESSRVGRAVISLVVAALTVVMVLEALPDSPLRTVTREPAQTPVQAIVDATGLSQSWRLFAPDPRDYSQRLVARLAYDDGTVTHWRPPEGGRVLATYRWWRWRKWASMVIRHDHLRPQAAEWLAATHRRARAGPVTVTLLEQRAEHPPPGSGAYDPPPYHTVEALFSATFDPDSRAGDSGPSAVAGTGR